jgi:hypothetical protein
MDLYSFAQENVDSLKYLEEVKIQSFKQPSSIQQLPYAVQSLSKKDLQQTNARTLPESMMSKNQTMEAALLLYAD